MSHQASWAHLIGRLLLALMFLVSGLNKIADPQGTQQYMAMMGMTWATTVFYLGAIALELTGSLSLLLGYRARTGAWLLFAFMIPATVVFHTDFSDQNQMIHFMKNLSVMGGLIYVGLYGAGGLSMDAGLERTERIAPPRSGKPVMKKVVHQ
jgi:putative oxidoreductase